MSERRGSGPPVSGFVRVSPGRVRTQSGTSGQALNRQGQYLTPAVCPSQLTGYGPGVLVRVPVRVSSTVNYGTLLLKTVKFNEELVRTVTSVSHGLLTTVNHHDRRTHGPRRGTGNIHFRHTGGVTSVHPRPPSSLDPVRLSLDGEDEGVRGVPTEEDLRESPRNSYLGDGDVSTRRGFGDD